MCIYHIDSAIPMCPVQKGIEFRDDIMALIKFWYSMHSDKKHLRSTDVTLGGKLKTNHQFVSSNCLINPLRTRFFKLNFQPLGLATASHNLKWLKITDIF